MSKKFFILGLVAGFAAYVGADGFKESQNQEAFVEKARDGLKFADSINEDFMSAGQGLVYQRLGNHVCAYFYYRPMNEPQLIMSACDFE